METAGQLREFCFDVAIDLQGLTKSAILARLSGAPRRLGFAQSEFEGRELSTWINNEFVSPLTDHVVTRGLELLRPLGIQKPEANFRLPAYEPSRAAMTNASIELGNFA